MRWSADTASHLLRKGLPMRALFMLLILLPWGGLVLAERIPHLSERGQQDFIHYQEAYRNKAFVIAPGGAWAWVEGEPDEQAAIDAATRRCRQFTRQTCVVYSVNDENRFDALNWPTLWRGDFNFTEENPLRMGTRRGERFPDLVFTDDTGSKRSISQGEGKVRMVHFWGAWCPPCMREFPLLVQLYKPLSTRETFELVMLQVREPIASSRDWAKRNGFAELPLYDSGASEEHNQLDLADGTQLPDRYFSPAFPTTFVLDKQGMVLFRHVGPVASWLEYLPFIEDVAEVVE